MEGINQDMRKYDKSLSICKALPSLEEDWNPSNIISVASDIYGSECNSDIVTETDEYNDGSMKPFPPSDM